MHNLGPLKQARAEYGKVAVPIRVYGLTPSKADDSHAQLQGLHPIRSSRQPAQAPKLSRPLPFVDRRLLRFGEGRTNSKLLRK